MEKLLKLGLAVLLFICLIEMPYGYYELIRFIALAVFGYLAYCSFREERIGRMLFYILLAVLFQPMIKLALGRNLWNIVDVVVGVGLLISLFFKSGRRKEVMEK